jgi:hypothetical protein
VDLACGKRKKIRTRGLNFYSSFQLRVSSGRVLVGAILVIAQPRRQQPGEYKIRPYGEGEDTFE